VATTIDTPIQSEDTRVELSLFATSDLHGRVLSFDYTKQAPSPKPSFEQLATVLETLRNQTPNSLLFDNGDLIQGTPFSDTLVGQGASGLNMHSFLGLCGYDVANLGNHDFDFGPSTLDETIKSACCPYVCANLEQADITFPQKSLMLLRTLTTKNGTSAPFKIGITGCVPAQTQEWVSAMGDDFRFSDPVNAIKAETQKLRASGADLIVVLAHSGYIADPNRQEPENFAQKIAQLSNVDAVFAGHLHYPDHSAVNAKGAPVSMPGCNATHIGRIDLTLKRSNGHWQTINASATTVAVLKDAKPHCDVVNISRGVHRKTIAQMTQLIGTTRNAIHSYFSRVAPSSAVQIIHDAQMWHLDQIATFHGVDALPRISVAAAGRTGGMEGSENYTFVGRGPLRLHHFFDIYRFENQFCAAILTGDDLVNWLEQSVSGFNTIAPHESDQPLFDPYAPGYDFDTMLGLDYEIDLSIPPRSNRLGQIKHDRPGRIRNVTHYGKPLALDQRFLVATTGFRVNQHKALAVYPTTQNSRDLLVNYVSDITVVDPTPQNHWRFSQVEGATATFSLPKAAADFIPSSVRIERAQPQGNTLLQYRLHL